MLIVGVALVGQPVFGAHTGIAIDLDRNTPGIQSSNSGATPIQGSVVVTGDAASDTVTTYTIQVRVRNDTQATDPLLCPVTTTAGDVPDAVVASNCNTSRFLRGTFNFVPVMMGADGEIVLFNFDADVTASDGDQITLSFVPTTENGQVGYGYNGQTQSINANNPGTPATFTVGGGGPTGTPMERTPCPDAGIYVLDSFGGRHSVGAPFPVIGPLYFGNDAARDLELAESQAAGAKGVDVPDLAVLDKNGVVHFVANESAAPGQSFFFPDGPAAVDTVLTPDSLGFWVLLVDGSVYAAGTAGSGLVGTTGSLGLNFPFTDSTGMVPRDPSLDPAQGTVRAVALGVPYIGDLVAGLIIIDSQGGHYLFNPDGSARTDNGGSPGNALDPATVYPFFPGLDIARDLEVHPNTQTSVIIYDGWGGTHPVPVSGDAAVGFIENTGPFAAAVGLPYVQAAFDDPSTEGVDEGSQDIDVNSVFRDLEFCLASTNDSNAGVYVMDAFGGIFAFGSTRVVGMQSTSPAPMLTGAPYFFPNLYAEDMEPTTLFPNPQ
jgi:hypothetical protein